MFSKVAVLCEKKICVWKFWSQKHSSKSCKNEAELEINYSNLSGGLSYTVYFLALSVYSCWSVS